MHRLSTLISVELLLANVFLLITVYGLQSCNLVSFVWTKFNTRAWHNGHMHCNLSAYKSRRQMAVIANIIMWFYSWSMSYTEVFVPLLIEDRNSFLIQNQCPMFELHLYNVRFLSLSLLESREPPLLNWTIGSGRWNPNMKRVWRLWSSSSMALVSTKTKPKKCCA